MSTVEFLHAHVRDTLGGDAFAGPNTSKKVLPECVTPKVDDPDEDDDLTDEQKTELVLSDPKFGMLSLFSYHLNHGRHNAILKKRNRVYCSHIFSLLFALPILVFVAQWLMYIAIVSHQVRSYNGDLCQNEAGIQEKIMMAAVSLLYFIKSFFLWDSIVDRTHRRKMIPATSFIVMFDTFQEFGFNLLVYLTNLWVIFSEKDFLNMFFNTMAMEYLMDFDNEFESAYFRFLPGVAVDIYDNMFVTYRENVRLIREKDHHSKSFRCFRRITWLPFKLLMFIFMILPVICGVMVFVGAACK